MLSDKAKGKQRAIDNSEPSRNLVIRFTEGIPDLPVSLSSSQSIKDLKKVIRDARPQLQHRHLRLIHAGRLLSDATLFYDWLHLLEERQRRVVADDQFVDKAKGKAKAVDDADTAWVNCSVGPAFKPGEEHEEKLQTAQLQPLRGFDRLSAAGFTEADISNFRRTFHSQSSSNYLDDDDFSTEEEYYEHAHALEEQWIDSLDDPLSASGSQSSHPHHASVLQGIMIGFFFPLIPFLFLHDPRPAVFWECGEWEGTASVVFSKRMQMGLVIGLLVNVLFGTWRYMLTGL